MPAVPSLSNVPAHKQTIKHTPIKTLISILLIFFSLAVTASFGAGAAAMAIGEPYDLKGAKDYAQFMEADFSSGAEVIDFVNAHFIGKGSRFNTLIGLPFDNEQQLTVKRKFVVRKPILKNETIQCLQGFSSACLQVGLSNLEGTLF